MKNFSDLQSQYYPKFEKFLKEKIANGDYDIGVIGAETKLETVFATALLGTFKYELNSLATAYNDENPDDDASHAFEQATHAVGSDDEPLKKGLYLALQKRNQE